jgi:hypothetical protein
MRKTKGERKITKLNKYGKKCWFYHLQLQRKNLKSMKAKVLSSLCLIKYHVMKTYPVLNETPRHEYENEEGDTLCGFCHIKYCDPTLLRKGQEDVHLRKL